MNLKAITAWLNKGVKPSTLENTFIPLERLKIAKTIYPNGKKQMSLNGVDEWYGMSYESNFKK
jgi:hypothetical protein